MNNAGRTTHEHFVCAAMVFLLVSSLSAQETPETTKLKAWSAEFVPEIIQVASGVYTAIGYGGSTLSMIVGDDGVIMVDTGSAAAATATARDEFRRISTLPVRAIIYTHGHRDHTNGSSLFVVAGAPPPEIWAQARFGIELGTLQKAGLTVNRERAARMFGDRLPPEKRINGGIAPYRAPQVGAAIAQPEVRDAPVPPNRLFDERATIRIAGVTLELVANPGETEDQLYVWFPERKVLFAGDNFYRCMPNLYAIRGTPYRDVSQWARAIDQLLTKDAAALVGGHTRPVVGKEAVSQALTDYRDTIRFVFEKTIEAMNKGLTPAELVQYVQLPDHLATKEYLQPYYGHPQWAVRSIFSGYLGWFDGNPANLFPLSPRAEAERVVRLAGGRARVMTALRDAIASADYQWAAQLSDHLLALDADAPEVKQMKAQALESLGEHSVNANARNYYLTGAQELRSGARGQ